MSELAARGDPVRIVFLGGLGEIGRNCMALEIAGQIGIIDCGVLFPTAEMLGIDLVLPDFSYLRERRSDIEAVFLTHAHEDHIGGLPYLVRDIQPSERIPVYGTELTLEILRLKLEEQGVADKVELISVRDRDSVETGPFKVEFIPMAHSVPMGCALAFDTPQGLVIHSGDFKIDATPVDGRATDLTRLGELGAGGVRLFMSDSTNAEDPGWIPSERTVATYLKSAFGAAEGRRVIAACFASHLHRIQQLADTAIDAGRRVAFLGRSMERNVEIAVKIGVLDIPAETIVDGTRIRDIPPGEICIISTGSQGEPLSALALMAAHQHKQISIEEGDVILFSSHPVPGNESDVHRVIDDLFRAGADVIHSAAEPGVHVSGHGASEDLKTILSLVRPEFFVPIHGEYRHLVHHARLAIQTGVEEWNALVAEDGDVLVLTDDGIEFEDSVPAGFSYVDGLAVGDVSQSVLRDRRALSEEGMLLVVVTIDSSSGALVSGPELITRGWIDAPESDDLLNAARSRVVSSIGEAAEEGATDWSSVRRQIRNSLGKFVWDETKRRPVIIPVVMEV